MNFLHQVYLILIVALKFHNKAKITFAQIDEEDHDLNCHTVITIKSVNDEEYEIQYQDLTCDPFVTSIRVDKNFITGYIKEVMRYDCIKGKLTISIDRVLLDNDLYHVGSVVTELTPEFWED